MSICGRDTPEAGSPSGIIGLSVARKDAVDKATGRAVYGPDVQLPNLLHGRILRSKYPHARIRDIDTTRAEKLPGVKAVATARDTIDVRYGVSMRDQSLFARDKVRHLGDAVAAVAAVSPEVAEEALGLIEVDYEELPVVNSAEEAMDPGSPLVHEHLDSYQPVSHVASWDIVRYGNVCSYTRIERGDIERGFQEADLIVEDDFSTQIAHQGYLEPHASLATVDPSGKVTVWTTNQKPFTVQSILSDLLQLPMTMVRVIPTQIGGGFGGKLELGVEGYCAVLAQKARQPVKIVLSTEEEFLAGNPRHSCHIWLKSGVKRDGTIVARQARVIFDTGAYSGNGPITVALSTLLVPGPYRVDNIKVEGYCVYTNKMSAGSCRGPSGPQSVFAIESHTDSIAAKLQMDPLEFRLKNCVQDGDLSPTGQVLRNVGLRKCLLKAASEIGWERERRERNQGRGIACMWWTSGGWATSACVRVNEDGTVAVLTGAVDMGPGAKATSLPQIVAEEFKLPFAAVHMVDADTDTAPYDHGDGGSRMTYSVGTVVRKAAEDAKRQLVLAASERLEAAEADIEVAEGRCYVKGAPHKAISMADLAADCKQRRGPILGRASHVAESPPYDARCVVGHPYPSFTAPSFAAQAAQVVVDADTGRVEVTKMVAAHDVGRAINPQAVEAQLVGGMLQGMGYATSEQLVCRNGRLLSTLVSDYLMPTALDAPELCPVIIEEPADSGPYGAKGVGEPPASPAAGAIANAVFDAVGVRIRQLPLTPERVLQSLQKRSLWNLDPPPGGDDTE